MLIIALKGIDPIRMDVFFLLEKTMNYNIFLLKNDKFYFKINILLPVRCF